jgi:hypothetical protein
MLHTLHFKYIKYLNEVDTRLLSKNLIFYTFILVFAKKNSI